MFNDDFLEKIFAHQEMQKIPIGCQSTAIHAFQDVLEDITEVNPYATISELFADSLSATDVPTEF